jgi:hypothetical protein
MPLAHDELIAIGIRQMDALLLAEEYASARAIGDDLIAKHPGNADILKAAAYAAFLDERGGDGFLRTVQLFDEARRLRPDDLEIWFWSAYTRLLWGDCSGLDETETVGLMKDLAFRNANSRYVAYACAHHPHCYKDRPLGERLIEHGMAILPNLMALWDVRIGLATSMEEREDLFRQAKAMDPFHDYCEMRSMDGYVAGTIAKDAMFRRSKSLDHLLLSGGLGEPPPSPLPSLNDLLLSPHKRKHPSAPEGGDPHGNDRAQ